MRNRCGLLSFPWISLLLLLHLILLPLTGQALGIKPPDFRETLDDIQDTLEDAIEEVTPERTATSVFPGPASITTGSWQLPPLMDVTHADLWKTTQDISAGLNGGIWILTRDQKKTRRIYEWTHREKGGLHWDPFRGLRRMDSHRLAGGPHGTCFWYDLGKAGIFEDVGVERALCTGTAGLASHPRDLAVGPDGTCWYLDAAGQLRSTGAALPAGVPANLTSVEVDTGGAVWLLGADQGIRCLEKGQLVTGLGSASAIACGGDGSVWCLDPKGLILFRREANVWQEKGRFTSRLSRLAVDSRGSPWLISDSRVYTTKRGLDSGYEHVEFPGTKPSWPKPTTFVTGFEYLGLDGTCIWNDKGSGGDFDVSYWRVSLPSGYVRFGDYAHPSWDFPSGVTMLVAKDNTEYFKPPTDYALVYDDKGSGADKDLSVWAPIAPKGYRALGYVAVNGYHKPNTGYVRCVREDLAVRGTIIGPLYIDKGTGADRYCSVYAIAPPNKDFTRELGIPSFRSFKDFVSWCNKNHQKLEALAAKKQAYQEQFLISNSFWAADKKDWKVTPADATVYVMKTPPTQEFQEYREACNRCKQWPAAVAVWRKARTWLWKKEEKYRLEADRIRQEKLKELLAAAPKNAPLDVVKPPSGGGTEGTPPAQKGYEEYRRQAGPNLEPALPTASPPTATVPARTGAAAPLPETVGKAVADLFQGASTTTELSLAKIECLRGLPGVDHLVLHNVTRTVTPSHLVLTGTITRFGQKDAAAFVAIHMGIDRTVKGCLGILPATPVRIRDAAPRPAALHDWFDRCFTFTRTAILLATDEDQLDGAVLTGTPAAAANAKAVLAPTTTSGEWQVGMKKGLNLFAVARLVETGPLGRLTKLPGWPAETYWQGLLPEAAEETALKGTVPMKAPKDWAVRPETFSVELTGKPAVTLAVTLQATIAGKTIAFACSMAKELGQSAALADLALVGTAECGQSDCRPPCAHLRLPILGLTLSKLLLKYAQEKDEKTGQVATSIGLAGTVAMGGKFIDVAGRLPLPPSFATAAFRGKTTASLLFHDLLLLAGKLFKGLDDKIVGAVGEFGLVPIDQPVATEDGPTKTEKVIVIAAAGKGDDDLGIAKGLTLKGGLVLGGLTLGAIDLQVDESTGITGSATLQPIDLGGILKLAGPGGRTGPRFEVRLNMKEQAMLLKGRADLLGLTGLDLTIQVKPSGLVAAFTAKVFSQLEADVTLVGKPSPTSPNLEVTMKMKPEFLRKLDTLITGHLTGALFPGVTPFKLEGAVVRGSLQKPTEAVYDLTVKLAILGIPQEVTIGSFDLAHPEKSMEEAARRLADLILAKAADLAAQAEKFVISSVNTINNTVNKGMEAVSKTTGIDFIGAKKELDSYLGSARQEAEKETKHVLKAGAKVARKTADLVTSTCKKVAETVKSFFEDIGRDGGVFNPMNW